MSISIEPIASWLFESRDSDETMVLLKSVLLPVLRQFEPSLIIVSAGFDAHERDPLGEEAASYEAENLLRRLVEPVRVVDDAGAQLGPRQTGHILVRTPWLVDCLAWSSLAGNLAIMKYEV